MSKLQLSSRRDGFALPMAILLVGFLTAGLVGAFSRQTSERAVLLSTNSQTNAFAVAEAGLENFMAAGSVSATTATYTFTKGTATVLAIQIRAAVAATDTAIWLIKSTGVANGGTPQNPAARRTVAQLAYKAPVTMQVLSSWTSLSGIRKAGGSGDIMGADACGGPAKAGATVPDGGISGSGDNAFSGSPAIDYAGTQQQLADSVKIDWAGITSTSAPSIAADIIYCRSGTSGYNAARTPCGSWPAAAAFTDAYWPTIIINGSSPLPGNGHGLLIVTGDLDLNGGDEWDGIILVGGIITDNGNGGISGAVITGLNVKLGQTVGESARANGTKEYSYNSCDVTKATNAMSKLSALSNAWMDNWNAW